MAAGKQWGGLQTRKKCYWKVGASSKGGPKLPLADTFTYNTAKALLYGKTNKRGNSRKTQGDFT